MKTAAQRVGEGEQRLLDVIKDLKKIIIIKILRSFTILLLITKLTLSLSSSSRHLEADKRFVESLLKCVSKWPRSFFFIIRDPFRIPFYFPRYQFFLSIPSNAIFYDHNHLFLHRVLRSHTSRISRFNCFFFLYIFVSIISRCNFFYIGIIFSTNSCFFFVLL